MHNRYLKLCLLTQAQSMTLAEYRHFILQAVRGGVTSIQLREKSKSGAELYQMAAMLKELLAPLGIPLIINDDVKLAKEINADGVHLGQTDYSPQYAREILGPDKIIGWSIESREELDAANQLDCLDYVAASAVFASKTKTNCKMIWGLAGLQEMVVNSRYPVIAIGGIDVSNAREVMEHGAKGVAVISAIHGRDDAENAAREMITVMRATESRCVTPENTPQLSAKRICACRRVYPGPGFLR